MAESFVQLDPDGTGKKLHSSDKIIGANTVHDEVVVQGEPYLASYVITSANVLSPSMATAGDHLLAIQAGASLNVYIRRILIAQRGLATAAAIAPIQLLRLTTAGSGGTVLTPRPLDTSDAAAGATARAIPSTLGTEGVYLVELSGTLLSAAGAGAFYIDLSLDDMLRTKPIRIPAGTANGIAIRNPVAQAGATVAITVWLTEANF